MTTMRKTERSRPSPTPVVGATTLRLYLTAFLAATYVVAWWLFGGRTPRSAAEPSVAPAIDTSGEPRLAAWFHALPPSQRPHVDVPAGWHIAESAAPTGVARRGAPAQVRVSPARPGRIRTRSS